MKVLKSVSSKLIVAIDIETVRYEDDFNDVDEAVQNAWEYKNKQAGEVPTQEELADLWKRQASLYAEFSKICAVSLAFLDMDGEKLMCKGIAGTSEHAILTDLAAFLDRILVGNQNYRLVGHASNYFDFPFMCKRYIINGLQIPRMLDDTDKKPWETANLDTNVLWKMGKTGPGSSLQALCVALNVPISKVDMVGDEVCREFFSGNLLGIREYCNKDAVATFNVFRRFKNESIFNFEEVIYLDDNDEDRDAEPIPIPQRLINTQDFSDDIKNELTELVKEKGLTKSELYLLGEIILAHYQAKGDKKADKERKEAEVVEYIKTIIEHATDY